MKVIDQINGSALFAQSAFSASVATKDDLGRDITATYLTGISLPESATWNDTSDVVKESSANWDNTSDIVKESSASWNQGKTYEGISPIVVNNNENKVSADTWTFSAGDNVSFVDDNVNKITRIDVELPTPQDLSYISAQTDKANQGVDYLSGVVITALPSDMATTGDVAELAQTIGETYYPNTNPSSFVNEDWVTAQGYITGVDLSEYAERAFVLSSIESATSGKLDVSSFASVSSDFLTTSFGISESATWNDTSDVVQSNSATWGQGGSGDEEVNELVHTNSATWNEVTNKLDTTAQVISSYSTATIEGITVVNSLNGKALISFRAQSAMKAGNADFASKANTAFYDTNGNSLTQTHNDLSALSSFVQTNSANWKNETISSYTSAWSTDVPPYGGYVIDSLNGKYLSAYISRSAANAATAHIADLATFAQIVDETKLVNDGFVKNLSSEYDTISVVRNTIESTNSAISRIGKEGFVSSFQDEGIGPTLTANFRWDKSLPNTTFNFTEDYASKNTTITYSANTNLTGEVTVTSVGTIPFSVSVPNATELNVWANDWVEIINNVASASDTFETVVGELAWASALPTYEYDITNKISAINGSALAGGGDVPTGTMNVSGLEYNAVNEISAYNGSAIAQYGAEKQWLVHDDTLVHLSNSAQYALGCNVSAVAQLLGVDETILWEGTDPLDQSCLVNGTRETATLSEPLSSFNKIRIYAVWNPWIGNFTGCNTFEYPGTNNKGGYIMNDCTNQGYIAGGSWSADGTTFKLIKHWQAMYGQSKETANGLGGIFKIVGIGRKA